MKSKNKIELLNFAKRAERRRSRIKIALVTGILIIVAIIVGIGGVEAGYAISNTTTNSSDINVLTISGPTNITAKVGEPVKPTSSFECKTKTGVSVTDAVYTASNLPDGLRMDKDTGIIYGTPTTPGSGDYTIVVTSTEHPNAHLKIDRSFEVSPADPKLLTILNATYITGHVDTPIAETPRLLCTTDTDVDAENVTYTASNLPDGLEINKDTGIISGTPTTKGAGIYTIHATAHVNTIKLSADFPTYFSIDSPFPTSLEITDVSDITGNVGEFIAATPLYCETNTDMVVKDPQYSIDSNTPLPEGLEINVSNGVISGTPIASVTKICTVNVTSASYIGLFGSANINITIGAQVPKSIVISGAQDISGDVGTEVSNISGLSCATDTGTPIQDAVYTASNLPNGLEINKDTGIIFGTPRTKQFGTYTINASAGDLVGTVSKAFSIDVKQSNPVTNAILDIQGMRDLAVPYRSTYKYECNGGTLSVDGDLPEGFTFSNNTITFSGSTPAEYGSFKLKATANDGSGKTNVITITYYPVEDIADGYCKFLYTDGRIADQALNVTADGTLYLTPTDCTNKILKAVYFNNNLSDVRTIGTNFLFDCHALTSVDLLPFTNVTSIGTNFLSYCWALTFVDFSQLTKVASIDSRFLAYSIALTFVDLSPLTNLTSIDDCFLYNCYALNSVNFSPLTKLTTIGGSFLANCTSLTSVDLSLLTNVTSIGTNFLTNCRALTSLDLSPLANVTSIDNCFLAGCYALTSIDLSPLANVTSLGMYFLSNCYALTSLDLSPLTNVELIASGFLCNCFTLTSIDLSPLISVTCIGDGFLAYCTALTCVKVGSIDFTGKIVGFNLMSYVTNLSTNKITGEKAQAFKTTIGFNINQWSVVS